jgi:hypothetical protein
VSEKEIEEGDIPGSHKGIKSGEKTKYRNKTETLLETGKDKELFERQNISDFF